MTKSGSGEQTALSRHLERAGALFLDGGNESVQHILQVVRQELGMELAYLAQFTDGYQVFCELDGAGPSFGVTPGERVVLDSTYCHRMVHGELPNLIRDAQVDTRARDLAVTSKADVGAYIGVPVILTDGSVYGSLCAVSHTARRSLEEYDVKFLRVLSRIIADLLRRQELEESNRRLELQAAGVDVLLRALEVRDGYTGAHSEAVVHLARAVARELGLQEDEVAVIEQTARLHDIGKIGIPDAILNKREALTEAEWDTMRRHPIIGAQIISSIDSLAHLAPAIRAEHERWDGKGYPDGLVGEEIPYASRIGFACDAYHAMVSDRPYRSTMNRATAMEELRRHAGTQFCLTTVQALLEVLASDLTI